MKPRVFVETDADRKRQLQMPLTVWFPDWVGQPASNANYAKQAEVLDGCVAEVGSRANSRPIPTAGSLTTWRRLPADLYNSVHPDQPTCPLLVVKI